MGVHRYTQSRDRLFPQKKRIHLPQPMKKDPSQDGSFFITKNTEKEAAQTSSFFCHISYFNRLAGISAAMRS